MFLFPSRPGLELHTQVISTPSFPNAQPDQSLTLPHVGDGLVLHHLLPKPVPCPGMLPFCPLFTQSLPAFQDPQIKCHFLLHEAFLPVLTRWPNLPNSHVYTFCLNHPFEEVIPCYPVCFLIPSCLPYKNDSPWQAETCLSCHLFSTKPSAVHTVGTPEILLNK